MHAHHCRIATGRCHGVIARPHGHIAPRSSACWQGRGSRAASAAPVPSGIGKRQRRVDLPLPTCRRRPIRAVIDRRIVGQWHRPADRPHFAMHGSTIEARVGDVCRYGEVRPHCSKIASRLASFSGFSTMSMRSWISDSMISYGVMPSSRIGTLSRSNSMPIPPLPAISSEEEVSPPRPCPEWR